MRITSPANRPVETITVRLPDPPGYAITGVMIGDDELKRDADGRVRSHGPTGQFDGEFVSS